MLVCDDLVIEILSWLPVKSLVRFMHASKSLNSFISDLSFVKLHLERSPKNAKLLIECFVVPMYNFFVSCDIPSLLDNTIPFALYVKHWETLCFVTEILQGLVCLVNRHCRINDLAFYSVNLWNPATRKTFGSNNWKFILEIDTYPAFGFGYDNLSNTYKVAAFLPNNSYLQSSNESYVLTATTYESCWREIECFPTAAAHILNEGVYIHNTLNWLGSTHGTNKPRSDDIKFDELNIISLDLGNETYTQFLLPRALYGFRLSDFYNLNNYICEPITIGVVKDCLSLFLQNCTNNHFSLWQMKEFGDQKSWTQLVNILVPDLEFCDIWNTVNLVPLCTFEDGHIFMVQSHCQLQSFVFFYRGSLTTTERPKVPCSISWICPLDYVESLVSFDHNLETYFP
ncbi:F-box/kelch-repeat protein, partial [Mucuna pruriens]